MQALMANHREQSLALLAGVQIDLVQHNDQWLVKCGQLDKGGVLGLVQVGIRDEENQVGPLGRFAGHFTPRAAADFVDSRRIDQYDLRFAQPRHGITRAVPGNVPDLARPAPADIDAGHIATYQGVDQSTFARADLAEDHDLDPAAGQLVVHLSQAGQLCPQAGFFFVGTLAHTVERLLDGRQGLLVGVGGQGDRSQETGNRGEVIGTWYSVLCSPWRRYIG